MAAIHSQFARTVAIALVTMWTAPSTTFAQDATTTTCTEQLGLGRTLKCTTRPESSSSGSLWIDVLGGVLKGYAQDRAAQTVRDAAAEAVRRDEAMVQAQQEIAAAANAAATREAERGRMLEASDRERIAAASRLFARRANEVRRTLADSLTLSATQYAAFSDSVSVIFSDLFVADPSASSARIADELRATFGLFQRQRKEFEKQVSDVVAKAMRGKKPFATAVEVEEVVSSIGALEDRPTNERGALIEAAIEGKLEARRSNEESCGAVALTCDPTRLDAPARRTYAAASATRKAETARQLPLLLARLDRVLDSLNVSADERADAHSHYSEVGYEYIATARLYVSSQRKRKDEAIKRKDEAIETARLYVSNQRKREDEAAHLCVSPDYFEASRTAASRLQHSSLCFASGEYLEKYGTAAGNMEKAAATYERACVLGDPRGCVNIGAMFEAGRGVVKSRDEAARAYERGCRLNSEAACTFLRRIR